MSEIQKIKEALAEQTGPLKNVVIESLAEQIVSAEDASKNIAEKLADFEDLQDQNLQIVKSIKAQLDNHVMMLRNSAANLAAQGQVNAGPVSHPLFIPPQVS